MTSLIEDITANRVVHTEDAECKKHGKFTYDMGGLFNALHWGNLRDRNGVAVLVADQTTRPLWRLSKETRGID